MSRDWYRDHHISPEAAGDDVYRQWAQDAGAETDLAGNVVWPHEEGHSLRRYKFEEHTDE